MTRSSILKLAGHTLALTWALFWIGAGLFTGISHHAGLGTTFGYMLAPGGLFLLLVLIVWRFEKVGAWMLLLIGLLIVTHLSRQPEAGASWVALAGPPLLGGVLLAIYHATAAASPSST